MGLTDFFTEINGKSKKHIDLLFDSEGMSIVCNKGERLTSHEIHYLTAVAFIHVGLELKGIIADPRETTEIGHSLYRAFYSQYEQLKTLGDMSLDEFNKYMLDSGM